MALYWYITDVIKTGSAILKSPPYDEICYKELGRGQNRGKRVRFRKIRNITYVARRKTNKAQPEKLLQLRFILLAFCEYLYFKFLSSAHGRKKRKRLEVIGREDPGYFLCSAIKNIPKCYVEDLDFYYSSTVSTDYPVDTRLLKGGYSVAYSSRIDRGLPTSLAQHGAFYGEAKTKGTEIESRLPDYFYTWGWKYAPNHVPHKPNQLMRFSNKMNSNEKKHLVLIVLPSRLNEENLNEAAQLYHEINGLARNLGLDVVIRPRPHKPKNKRDIVLRKLKSFFGNEVLIDKSSDAAASVSRAFLVVCVSHPATVFFGVHACRKAGFGFV